jgi:hypothetical protein
LIDKLPLINEQNRNAKHGFNHRAPRVYKQKVITVILGLFLAVKTSLKIADRYPSALTSIRSGFAEPNQVGEHNRSAILGRCTEARGQIDLSQQLRSRRHRAHIHTYKHVLRVGFSPFHRPLKRIHTFDRSVPDRQNARARTHTHTHTRCDVIGGHRVRFRRLRNGDCLGSQTGNNLRYFG